MSNKVLMEFYYNRCLKTAFFLNHAAVRWFPVLCAILYILFFFKITVIPNEINFLKYLIPSIYGYSHFEKTEYIASIYSIFFLAIFYYLYLFFRIFGSPFNRYFSLGNEYDYSDKFLKIFLSVMFFILLFFTLFFLTPAQYQCIKKEISYSQLCLGIQGSPSQIYIFHLQYFFCITLCIWVLCFTNYTITPRTLKKYGINANYTSPVDKKDKKCVLKELLHK